MENGSISVPSKIITEHNGYTCEYKLVKVTAWVSKDKTETILSQEDSTNENGLFEELFSTFFVLDKGSRCTRKDIQKTLSENANNVLVKAIGFKLDNLQYCSHNRAFLKNIASLDGVKESRFKYEGGFGQGFKGIKVK